MNPLRMLISSLSFLYLFSACSSPKGCLTTETKHLPEILPVVHLTTDKPALYQAGFSVLKYEFSGLIAFRKMTDNEIRVAFISEMGLKLMEFSLRNNVVSNTYCMPAINKKARIKFVEQFLGLLLHQPRCNKTCQLDEPPNSSYFCKADGEEITLNYENELRKGVYIEQNRRKNVDAHYVEDIHLPEKIHVEMKYKTRIELTLLKDAFN